MHHHYYVAQHSTLFIRNFRTAFPIIPFLFTRVSKSKNNHPHLKPAIQKFKHGAKFAIEMREKQIPAARKKRNEEKKINKNEYRLIHPAALITFFSSAVFPARWTLRQKLWWTVWTYLLSERWSLKPARWNEKSQAYLQHDVTI